jgi:hypothetical protein
MPNLKQICDHEISHGIVAERQGFTDYTHIFVDLRTKSSRRGGIDVSIEGLKQRFDTKIPVAERRALAVQIVAIFAAGSEGEKLMKWDPDPDWSSWDEEQIELFGLLGVYEDEDLQLLNKSKARTNGWGKWELVDALIAEGREVAAKILAKDVAGLRTASTMLHQFVNAKGSSDIKRPQLLKCIGKK